MPITRSKPEKIEKWHGDTERIPIRFTSLNKGTDERDPVDVSLYTNFRLAVNVVANPVDITEQLEEMIGSFVSDGVDGRVYFVPTGNIPIGIHFYDVSYVNEHGEKATKKHGEYDVAQDVGKS